MHEGAPYDLVRPPREVIVDGAAEALLLARWRDRSLVLVDGSVSWVNAAAVTQLDWAPWGTAVAANA